MPEPLPALLPKGAPPPPAGGGLPFAEPPPPGGGLPFAEPPPPAIKFTPNLALPPAPAPAVSVAAAVVGAIALVLATAEPTADEDILLHPNEVPALPNPGAGAGGQCRGTFYYVRVNWSDGRGDGTYYPPDTAEFGPFYGPIGAVEPDESTHGFYIYYAGRDLRNTYAGYSPYGPIRINSWSCRAADGSNPRLCGDPAGPQPQYFNPGGSAVVGSQQRLQPNIGSSLPSPASPPAPAPAPTPNPLPPPSQSQPSPPPELAPPPPGLASPPGDAGGTAPSPGTPPGPAVLFGPSSDPGTTKISFSPTPSNADSSTPAPTPQGGISFIPDPNPTTDRPPIPSPTTSTTPAPTTPTPAPTSIEKLRRDLEKQLNDLKLGVLPPIERIDQNTQPAKLREAAKQGACDSFEPGQCNADIKDNISDALDILNNLKNLFNDDCAEVCTTSITVPVFLGCDSNNQPTFTNATIKVTKGNEEQELLVFQRLAQIEAKQCEINKIRNLVSSQIEGAIQSNTCEENSTQLHIYSGSGLVGLSSQINALSQQVNRMGLLVCDQEATLALPDYWQFRPESHRPQLIFMFAEIFPDGTKGVPMYSISIPHPIAQRYSSSPLPPYQKGQWEGILTLKDNSKVIVNAVSIEEVEKVLDAAKLIIQPAYLDGSFQKIGVRKGQELLKINVKSTRAVYFSTGTKKLRPDWIDKF